MTHIGITSVQVSTISVGIIMDGITMVLTAGVTEIDGEETTVLTIGVSEIDGEETMVLIIGVTILIGTRFKIIWDLDGVLTTLTMEILEIRMVIISILMIATTTIEEIKEGRLIIAIPEELVQIQGMQLRGLAVDGVPLQIAQLEGSVQKMQTKVQR
jgi:hypothetical protein